MCVPVWYLRAPFQISQTVDKFLKSSEPRSYGLRPLWPPDCFWDDGYVRGCPPLHDSQTNTSNCLKAIDSWGELKLKGGFR